MSTVCTEFSVLTDQKHNDCSKPAEPQARTVAESNEYIEAKFSPGSVVWAKMRGFPWYAYSLLFLVLTGIVKYVLYHLSIAFANSLSICTLNMLKARREFVEKHFVDRTDMKIVIGCIKVIKKVPNAKFAKHHLCPKHIKTQC